MCMKFSNKGICEYFVIPISKFIRSEVRILFHDEKIDKEGNKLICDVSYSK